MTVNKRLIVDNREVGKTTYLFNTIKSLLDNNKKIIVLDSATDHETKSLLKKVCRDYQDALVLNPSKEELIQINKWGIDYFVRHYQEFYPYNEIVNSDSKIICFDLSYFLEKGHDVFDETHDKNKYNYYRRLYNDISYQVVLTLAIMAHQKLLENYVAVMDEIELPIVDYDDSYINDNLECLAAVHPDGVYGTFYQSFSLVPSREYRRKDW